MQKDSTLLRMATSMLQLGSGTFPSQPRLQRSSCPAWPSPGV